MLTNFEDITQELSEDELSIVPVLILGFQNRTKENPIKAPNVVIKVNEYLRANNYKIKLTEPRLRKIVNHIRTNALLPLIATSNGYYVSNDRQEILNQIESLEQKANSIARCALGLKKFIKNE